MDTHTLNILEFSSYKQLLNNYTSSSLAKKIISSLIPDTDILKIKTRQKLSEELINIFKESKNIPGEGTPDIEDILQRIHIENTILDTEGFMILREFLRCTHQIRKFILSYDSDKIVNLIDMAESIPYLSKLENALNFVFTDDGKIKDTASAKLKSIRAEIKKERQTVLKKLQHIIDKKKDSDCFYNDQITLREGRYVLFVKSERRGMIDGVIHDKSMSGATCFVEPSEVIENGNRLRTLSFDERNEILRIKKFLSNLVRDDIASLKQMIEPISELEMLFAGAKLAIEYNMISPFISSDRKLRIINGYHPLLLARLKNKTVPLNIDLDEDNNTVIITGPNMGGKTVSLKTIGLLCLIFQSGLPVPVSEGSFFPVFEAIYSDIGDEQSLQNDMSTFSSHIIRINEIISKKNHNSLVLIDELGTGTDPIEGAALAIAILEELIEKKFFTVANTHLFQLKLFASNKIGVRNASMLFDVSTSKPSYTLVMNIPGSSNALEIAKNLGISKDILAKANSLIGNSPADLDLLIKHFHTEKTKLIEECAKYTDERKTFQILSKRYKDKLLKFEEEKNLVLAKKLSEMNDSIKQIKKEFELKVSQLESPDRNQLKQSRRKLDQHYQKIRKDYTDIQSQLIDEPEEIEEDHKTKTPEIKWNVGDIAIVAPFMNKCKILSISDKKKKAIVLSDNTQIEVPLSNLSAAVKEDIKKKSPVFSIHINKSGNSGYSPVLDLRGLYVDDAIPKLDKHLSDSILRGFKSFTVIHGFGTGRMKNAVIEFLSKHPQIKNFRNGNECEGGLGVTIVEIE